MGDPDWSELLSRVEQAGLRSLVFWVFFSPCRSERPINNARDSQESLYRGRARGRDGLGGAQCGYHGRGGPGEGF